MYAILKRWENILLYIYKELYYAYLLDKKIQLVWMGNIVVSDKKVLSYYATPYLKANIVYKTFVSKVNTSECDGIIDYIFNKVFLGSSCTVRLMLQKTNSGYTFNKNKVKVFDKKNNISELFKKEVQIRIIPLINECKPLLTISLYLQQDHSRHRNMIILENSKSKIIINFYGLDKCMSRVRRFNIYKILHVLSLTLKSFTIKQVEIKYVSCPIVIHKYISEQRGYCKLVSLFWLYITLMIYKLYKNSYFKDNYEQSIFMKEKNMVLERFLLKNYKPEQLKHIISKFIINTIISYMEDNKFSISEIRNVIHIIPKNKKSILRLIRKGNRSLFYIYETDTKIPIIQ